MGVHDLWFRSKKGPDGERIKSGAHGRGKRWRVRYYDASGNVASRVFDRKVDAEAFDAAARNGTAPEIKLDQGERHSAFDGYAERWRLARNVGWAIETRRRVESNLRLHILPEFGNRALRSITQTDVLLWLAQRLGSGTPQSSMRLYFELLDAVLAGALTDKLIPDNPCAGIKLSQVFKGLTRAPKWVPTEAEVVRLFDVVPERYHGLLWLGGGAGLRISEALGFEDGPRCLDIENEELHVVQQLRYAPRDFGGFYLSEPKSGSSGTVDLDPVVGEALTRHVRNFPPVEVEMPDTTTGRPFRRQVPLLFTTTHGNPFTDRTWSAEWVKWRERAGWPKEHGGFHALRHFFATTLITNHADPKEVQRALRHRTLQITLETYVHFWPRRERRRGVVGQVLQRAAQSHQDQP